MTRGRVVASMLAALPLAGPGASGDPAPGDRAPACLARAQVVPPEGFPGQQLVWRLEILRRPYVTGVEWLEPPSFPGFRAEWLPGQPDMGGVRLEGVEYIARVEERALFPERSGELVIAGAGLRCALSFGPPLLASVAATRVRVMSLPEEGRPPGFSGLVGALAVEVAARPRQLSLGGSTRLEVTLRGDANLWDARDPLTGAPDLAGVELFPARPRLELEPGIQLSVRRQFAYQVVPNREGRVEVPELRVPYFDPERRRYEVATSPALALEVGPRAAAHGAAHPPEPEADPRTTPRGHRWWALGALAAGGLLVWSWRLRALRSRGAAHLAELGASDDAAQRARALRLALEPRLAGARSAPVEELHAPLGADPAVERALALLARVERSRFDPHAPPVPRAEVALAIRALSKRAKRARSEPKANEVHPGRP